MSDNSHPPEKLALYRRSDSDCAAIYKTRFHAFSGCTVYALKEFRRICGEQGTDNPAGVLAHDLALIWRRSLGPKERLFLTCVATLAVDGEDLALAREALDADAAANAWPFPGVDRELFRRVVRENRQGRGR